MRKWFLCLLLLLLALPAAAQTNSGWTAWLFDPGFGNMRLVNDTGETLDRFRLPLAQAFNSYGPEVAVSPSGGHVAYLAFDSTTAETNLQLFVFDRALQSIAAAHSLPINAQTTTLDLLAVPTIFDESAFELAFGYGAGPDAQEPGWEIITLNYRSGMVSAVLSSEDEAAADLPASIIPVIHSFDDGAVTFAAVQSTGQTHNTYRWSVGGAVQPVDTLHLGRAVLPTTGEIIYPAHDSRLPAAADGAMNVLVAAGSLDSEQVPFYHSESRFIVRAFFVQNGERVLAAIADGSADALPRWTLIERDGTEVQTLELPTAVTQVFMTPDGFVYLAEGLTAITTRDGSFSSDTRWANDPGNPLELIHVQSLAPAPESFTPWAQLADPLD